MKMQKKIVTGFILTLIIVIFFPLYWAMEPGRQEAALNRQQAEAAARGHELYAATCAACHGAQGEGGIGPTLKGTPLDDDTLEKIIARGIPRTAMVAWSKEDDGPLHRQQIKDLVTFIKNWGGALATTPAPTLQTTPSAIAAGELYTIRCAGCHGANRQGISGLGSTLTPESLAGLSDNEVRDTILNGRSGTVMPAFKEILSPDEIDALRQLLKYTSP